MYTSGSTGKPKGVEVLDRSLVNILLSMQEKPGLTSKDVLLAITTLTFDIATLELLLPMVVGARLVIASREDVADAARLAKKLALSSITVMQATPAVWRLLVDAGWQGGAPFQKAFCGGEALSRKLANDLLNRGVSLWNLYGPTETTIWSTVHEVTSREGPVPIGQPVCNTQIHVLDSNLQPVPFGEPGELHLGGIGLARGYLNRPEQTAERFIPDPFSSEPGDRLYKTGDLVRYLPDGNLEYLGRLDHQVKIRGYRIELGEIETVLEQYPGVRGCLVMAREDVRGDKRLVAYLVANSKAEFSLGGLRGFLKAKLPHYMVPSAFELLDAFPLGPNGKVDRKALPALKLERPELNKPLFPPRNEAEQKLVRIWEELLGIHPIGVRDNFFEIGGDSLLAAHLLLRIREAFGQDLPMSTLVHEATVEHLAGLIEGKAAESKWPSLVEVQSPRSKPPIYFIHALGGEILIYRPLAPHLGPDQPLYALRAQTDGGREPFTRIEDMAAHYLKEVLAIQQQGPFFLGGFSFGAIVAFEMAQQLQRQGHQVAFLAVIDMEFPYLYRKYMWRLKWFFKFAMNAPRWLFHGLWGYTLRQRLALIRQRISVVREVIEGLLRLSEGDPHGFGAVVLPDLSNVPEKHCRVFHANHKALMAYVPQTYPGRITVVRARTQPLIRSFENDMGWAKLAAGGTDVIETPGFHSTIFNESNIAFLAKGLRKALKKAEASCF
jgi:thioesterase domain-containing protein/acyl carrier protein